jgi:mRNA interferase MazF
MKAGDIALMAMPQADGKIKNRPVVLLKKMPPYNDWLVAGVSTQLHQEVNGFDVVLKDTDAGFAASRLKASSLIRLGFLDVTEEKNFRGTIGTIDTKTVKLLLERLASYLLK